MLFVFGAAVFIFLAGPFFGLCARAARATHKNYDFFIMDFFQKFSLPFGFWSVVFYFWPDLFFLFGQTFFRSGFGGYSDLGPRDVPLR